MLTFAALEPEYASLLATASVRPEARAAAKATARKIFKAKARYVAVGARTGVPWWVIGIVHALEAGCRFDRHLHNGDPLTERTVQVPKGRPVDAEPPYEWEASACDAMAYDHLDKVKDWSLPRALYELEKYNGFGYRTRSTGIRSPYLWSGTTHYKTGKFVADGRYDPSAVSGQSGAYVLLDALRELDPSLAIEEASPPDPATEFTRTPAVRVAPDHMGQSTTGNAAVGVGSGSLVTAGVETGRVAAAARLEDGTLDWGLLVIQLMQSPLFWAAAASTAAALYIWLERRRKLRDWGI